MNLEVNFLVAFLRIGEKNKRLEQKKRFFHSVDEAKSIEQKGG